MELLHLPSTYRPTGIFTHDLVRVGIAHLMRMHIQRIDRQIICCEVERLKDLLQCQVFPVSMYHGFLMELTGQLTPLHRSGQDLTSVQLTFGVRFNFDLMKRRRCFWFMLAEWWICVSTFRTL